jgi:beta-N-acetylhexosaminidase
MNDSDLRRLAASLFVIGFNGTEAAPETIRLLDEGCAGFILFKRNIVSAAQTAALIRQLKSGTAHRLIAAVDQEGGRVARLRGNPFTAVPSMKAIGRSGDLEFARRVGQLLAFETRSVGFDFNFAPVVDIDTNPNNPVIGDRAFSDNPNTVAAFGVALAQGLESHGVASCAKHFPGHGDTSQDSHLQLPTLSHSLERLRQVELIPFAAYAQAKLASVMTAHVRFETLDNVYPATMSVATLRKLLRNELQFDGVVVSDDLEMKAIAEHYTVEDAVVRGVEAGIDIFLVCHSEAVQRRAIGALVSAVQSGRLPASLLQQAQQRVERLATRFVRGAETLEQRLGSPEHRYLAQGIAAESVALVDPTEAALPQA